MAKKTWSQKLADTRVMKGEGAAIVFDRVTLYQEIFNDADFAADCEDRGVSREKALDEECADLCCGVLVLLEVLRVFPARVDWEKRHLDKMVAEIVEKSRADKGERSTPNKSWKSMYEELASTTAAKAAKVVPKPDPDEPIDDDQPDPRDIPIEQQYDLEWLNQEKDREDQHGKRLLRRLQESLARKTAIDRRIKELEESLQPA